MINAKKLNKVGQGMSYYKLKRIGRIESGENKITQKNKNYIKPTEVGK